MTAFVKNQHSLLEGVKNIMNLGWGFGEFKVLGFAVLK